MQQPTLHSVLKSTEGPVRDRSTESHLLIMHHIGVSGHAGMSNRRVIGVMVCVIAVLHVGCLIS